MHAPVAASQLFHAGGLVQSPIVGSACITSVLSAEVQIYIVCLCLMFKKLESILSAREVSHANCLPL